MEALAIWLSMTLSTIFLKYRIFPCTSPLLLLHWSSQARVSCVLSLDPKVKLPCSSSTATQPTSLGPPRKTMCLLPSTVLSIEPFLTFWIPWVMVTFVNDNILPTLVFHKSSGSDLGDKWGISSKTCAVGGLPCLSKYLPTTALPPSKWAYLFLEIDARTRSPWPEASATFLLCPRMMCMWRAVAPARWDFLVPRTESPSFLTLDLCSLQVRCCSTALKVCLWFAFLVEPSLTHKWVPFPGNCHVLWISEVLFGGS